MPTGAQDEETGSSRTTPRGSAFTGNELALLSQTRITGDRHPKAGQPDDADSGAPGDQKRQGSDAPRSTATPKPTPPGVTNPGTQSPTPAPPSTAKPEPSEPPATEPSDDDKPGDGDDGLCLGVPPVLELCLSGNAK